MVRSLFGNSNRKLRSTFWGSPFIPVGTNQTECCLPLTNFSVPSRFQTHATQIRPFLDSNRNGCGISTVNWQIAYHYTFATPTGFFCQMVSTHCCQFSLKFRIAVKIAPPLSLSYCTLCYVIWQVSVIFACKMRPLKIELWVSVRLMLDLLYLLVTEYIVTRWSARLT